MLFGILWKLEDILGFMVKGYYELGYWKKIVLIFKSVLYNLDGITLVHVLFITGSDEMARVLRGLMDIYDRYLGYMLSGIYVYGIWILLVCGLLWWKDDRHYMLQWIFKYKRVVADGHC